MSALHIFANVALSLSVAASQIVVALDRKSPFPIWLRVIAALWVSAIVIARIWS